MKSFSLIATRISFCKVSSALERSSNGETMALDFESGLKESLCGLFVEDEVEEKHEADMSRIHYLEERDEEMLSKILLKLSRLDKVRSASEQFDSMRLSSSEGFCIDKRIRENYLCLVVFGFRLMESCLLNQEQKKQREKSKLD